MGDRIGRLCTGTRKKQIVSFNRVGMSNTALLERALAEMVRRGILEQVGGTLHVVPILKERGSWDGIYLEYEHLGSHEGVIERLHAFGAWDRVSSRDLVRYATHFKNTYREILRGG